MARHSRTALVGTLCLLTGACTVPVATDRSAPPRHGVPTRFEGPTLGVAHTPYFRLKVDEDRGAAPDLDSGTGYGLFYGETGLQVNYLGSRFTERSTGGDVDLHLATIGFAIGERQWFDDDYEEDVWTYVPYFGLSIGAAMLDYRGSFDDEFGAVLQARFGCDLDFGSNTAIGIVGAYQRIGYPGESIARGVYVGVEGRVQF